MLGLAAAEPRLFLHPPPPCPLLLLSSLVVDVTICTIGEIRDDLSDKDGILVAAGLRIDAEDLLIALQVFKWHSTSAQENAVIQQQRAFQAARLACRRLEPANVKCIKAADDCDLAAADEAVRGCLDQMVVVFAGRQVPNKHHHQCLYLLRTSSWTTDGGSLLTPSSSPSRSMPGRTAFWSSGIRVATAFSLPVSARSIETWRA